MSAQEMRHVRENVGARLERLHWDGTYETLVERSGLAAETWLALIERGELPDADAQAVVERTLGWSGDDNLGLATFGPFSELVDAPVVATLESLDARHARLEASVDRLSEQMRQLSDLVLQSIQVGVGYSHDSMEPQMPEDDRDGRQPTSTDEQ